MHTDHIRFDTIARHYNWLREQGTEHAQAISELKEGANQKAQALIGKLEAIQQGTTSNDEFISGQLGALTQFVDQGKSSTEERLSSYIAARSLQSSLNSTAAKIRTRLTATFGYMGFLCVFGLLISTMYAVYVLPQLDALYSTFHRIIPAGTLVSLGILGYPLVFLLLTLVTLGLYLAIVNSTYKLAEGRNFAAPLHWVPGVSKLNRAIKHYLYIGIQRICARNGLGPDESFSSAKNYTSYEESEARESLSLVWELDTAENEFAYQLSVAEEQVESSLLLSMRVVTTALTVLILITMGSMVVNLYVPIFNMSGIM